MKTMISKEHFNDITLAKFFHHIGKTSNYKPQFKKSGLAAINLGVQYHHLESINAFKHIWSH